MFAQEGCNAPFDTLHAAQAEGGGLVIGVSLGESHMMEYNFTQSTYFRYSEDKVESNSGSGTSCKANGRERRFHYFGP